MSFPMIRSACRRHAHRLLTPRIQQASAIQSANFRRRRFVHPTLQRDFATTSPPFEHKDPSEPMFRTDHDISIYELNLYYNNEHDIPSVADHITAEESLAGWTATFICPVTHKAYESGSLPGLDHTIEDGRVWYPKKKVAVRAAGARALDAIRFRDTGLAEPRICEEIPVKVLASVHYEQDDEGGYDEDEEDAIVPVLEPILDAEPAKDEVEIVEVKETPARPLVSEGHVQAEEEEYVITAVDEQLDSRPYERILRAGCPTAHQLR